MKKKKIIIIMILSILMLILGFYLLSYLNKTDFQKGDYVYYDPINDSKCSSSNYWTTYNKSSTCYRWIVLETGHKLNLLLDHNYIFNDGSNTLKYSEIDKRLEEIKNNWKHSKVDVISIKTVLEYMNLDVDKELKKLKNNQEISANDLSSIISLGNYSYDSSKNKMIYYDGYWITDKNNSGYILYDEGQIKKADLNNNKTGLRPTIRISNKKLINDETSAILADLDFKDGNVTKESLQNNLSGEDIQSGFDYSARRALHDYETNASDLAHIFPITTAQRVHFANNPDSDYPIKDRYYGIEAFNVQNNRFCIYMERANRGANNTSITAKPGFYCITKSGSSFLSSGYAYTQKNYGHGNDITYNSGNGKYIVTDDSGDVKYYLVQTSNLETGSKSYPLMLSTSVRGSIAGQAYNNISAMNDRYNLEGKSTCEENKNSFRYDYCSNYIYANGGAAETFKIVTPDNTGPRLEFQNKKSEKVTGQTLEYHKGYTYRVYSESCENEDNLKCGTGVIHVFNTKLNKKGNPSKSYGTSTILLYANLRSTNITNLSTHETNTGIDARTKQELQAVSFTSDSDDNMYILSHARKFQYQKDDDTGEIVVVDGEKQTEEVDRYPYIYQVGLSSIVSNSKYIYNTNVYYYDDNTTADIERYYANDIIDLNYYDQYDWVENSSKSYNTSYVASYEKNEYLGWIYSRTGGGLTTIQDTFVGPNENIITQGTDTVGSRIQETLKTVKLTSTKYSNIATTSSTNVTDETIQAFLSNLTCKRCTAVVIENGNTEKTNGEFIAGRTYQLKVKAADTNSTQALLKPLSPTIVTGGYSITYDLNGGEATNPSSYTIDTETFTLNNPTREGYTFTGWTGSNGNVPQTSVTITQGTTGNLSYTANWQVNSYTVTFNTNGGSAISSQTVAYNGKVTQPTNPTKSNNTFGGWYSNSELTAEYDFDTSVTEDLTLYAKWISNNTLDLGTVILIGDSYAAGSHLLKDSEDKYTENNGNVSWSGLLVRNWESLLYSENVVRSEKAGAGFQREISNLTFQSLLERSNSCSVPETNSDNQKVLTTNERAKTNRCSGVTLDTTAKKNKVKWVIVVGGYNDNGFFSEGNTCTSLEDLSVNLNGSCPPEPSNTTAYNNYKSCLNGKIQTFLQTANQMYPNASIALGMVGWNYAKYTDGTTITNKRCVDRQGILYGAKPSYESLGNTTNLQAIYISNSGTKITNILHNSDYYYLASMGGDGVHPNSSGQSSIYEFLRTFLDTNTLNIVYHRNFNSSDSTTEKGIYTTAANNQKYTSSFTNSRTGYNLIGWSTSASSDTVSYIEGAAISTSYITNNSVVDLYAVWEPAEGTQTVSVPTSTAYCKDLVYNGSSQTLVNTADVGFSWVSGTTTGTHAVSYTVKANINPGYVWNDGTTTEKQITCHISPKTLDIPTSPSAKTYNGYSQESGITCPSGSTASGTEMAMNANTYTQTCSLSSTTNYIWSDNTSTAKSIEWTILPKTLQIPETPNDKTYNGSSQESGIECPNGSAVSGTQIAMNANTYTQTCTLSSTTNYKWSDNTTDAKSITWKISKKDLSITAKDQEITYGEIISKTTNDVTTSGLISGHSLSTITLTPSTTNVTTSGTITPSAAEITSSNGDVTSNYNITYNAGELVINGIRVTIPTNSYCNSNLTYNGEGQTLVREASSGFNWDIETTIGVNAGNHTVEANLYAGHVWSDGTTTQKTITCSIAKATPTLTVSPTSGTTTEGHNLTFQEKANVAGNFTNTSSDTSKVTVNPVNTQVTANTNKTVTVVPVSDGIATVTVTFVPTDTTNYNSITASSTGKKTYTATIVDSVEVPTSSYCKSLTYNGEEQTLVNNASSGFSWVTNTTKGTDAGSYTVKANIADGYRWSDNTTEEKEIECSIERKSVAEPNCISRVYNGEEQTLLDAKTSGEYTNSAIKGTNAGSYSTTLVLNRNYKWSSGTNVESSRTKTCSIAKATPEVSNIEIATSGIVVFDSTNANSYEISTDGVNYSSIESGNSYLNNIIEEDGERTIYLRGKNNDTLNYESTSEVITKKVEVHKITINNDASKGTISDNSYNVIEGAMLSVSGNKITVIGEVPNRRATATLKTITATPKEGYSFSSWTGVDEVAESNMTVTANYNLITYQITYNLGGGSATNPDSYTVNTETFTLNNPTKTGAEFLGWTGSNGNVPQLNVTIESGSTGNKNYTAHWESTKYTVTFNSNGGSTVASQEVGHGEKALEPNTPTKEGYAFEGWYSDSELTQRYDFDTEVTGNKTLYAKWIAGKYQITYELGGGSAENPTYYDINTETFTLNNPIKEGYTFRGWTGSNGSTPQLSVTITQGTTGDKRYIANWGVNSYTVTFNTNGGSSIDSLSVEYGRTVTRPSNPTKSGYEFIGWYTDSSLTEEYNFDSPVTKSMTLYAGWAANIYRITFNTNGGSSISPMEAAYGELITEPEAPSKEGHTFAGWYSNSELTDLYTFTTMPAENITLYAKWERSEYQVIFNANGGSAVENQNVLYGDRAERPSNPVRSGYEFKGWYSDSSFENSYNFENSVTRSIILYAKWNAIEYDITYTLNGGEATNPNSYTIETNTFTLNNPTKEGYRFLGWTGSNGNTPEEVTINIGSTGNKTFIANYEVIKYTVTFNSNGGSAVESEEVNHGETVAAPVTPTKEGYAFGGWYKDDNLTEEYSFDSLVTKNMTLYAKWITGSYQITYDLDGGVANNPTYYDIETPTFTLEAPTKTGYTFKGWTGSNGETPQLSVTIEQGTTGNKNYTAHYEAIEYKIDFNYEGIDSIEETYGSEITLPTPRKTGYRFLGWYIDSSFTELFDETTMPAENLTLYPKFEINIYTISFNTNGGNGISAIDIAYNGEIPNLPTPVKEGYRFLGWYSDSSLTEEFNMTNMPAENITIYAKWEINTYTVTFNSNGGSTVASVEVAHNDQVSRPTDPEKNGYIFEDWYSDSNLTTVYDFTDRITKDITLYAKWEERTYSISYDLDGGVANNKTSYTINTATFTLNNPTKEGYTFIGWTGSNGTTPEEEVTIEEGTTGNKTYVANYRVNSYTISFDSNGGSSVSSITKNYGETVTAPENPTREGYKFAGWYSDSNLTRLYSFTTMPSEDIILYAKWTNNEFVISYVLNGGVNDPSNPTTYTGGTTVTLKDASKEGYVFKGWYSDSSFEEQITSITADMSEDITLYAKFEVIKYQIIFETNGGEAKESIELAYQEEIPNIKDPTRVGYTFKGWYNDAELTSIFSEEIMPNRNITLYAKWEINRYTITYNSNGGSKVEPYEADYNTKITAPTNPLKEGYKFAGWYSDKELTKLYSFVRMPAKDITLYAKWISNSKNSISYDLNGGKNSTKNPSSYTSGKDIILYNPTKRGSKFAGWYLDPDFQTRVYKITKDMSGDLVLYAKWIPEEGTYIPDTGTNISVIAIISGVILVSVGGYFILSKKEFFKKLKH